LSSLGPAHRGYNYQDLVTAYHLASALARKYDAVTVDHKETGADDRFDDISVRSGSQLTRKQIKSSENAGLAFELQDLTTTRRNLEVDNLVRCYRNAGDRAADEYRLCATWREPANAEFRSLLEPVAAEPTFNGYPTKTYRLRADIIWPEASPPMWRRLRDATDITRQDFQDFAARFIIELECPPASTNPAAPDKLEQLLLDLLTDTIGVGRYPNHTRNSVDVATQLMQLAARARARMQTLTPPEIEAEIQLRKDFGRVAQEFPVIKAVEVKRPTLHDALRDRLDRQRIILIGAPGSGKSWALTDLGDSLEQEGRVVARHYCYLEPGDQQVQRRITTDVLFANLIYDLVRARPALREIHRPIYAAGPRELEELLRKAIDQGIIDEATLIVDGVDHISRVFAEQKNLSPEDVDIVEELAALDLPDGVRLIVGSQPGAHLDPLRTGADTIVVPGWELEEVTALANNLGVPSALTSVGLGDTIDGFLEQLLERSEGNPLYATFLCRQTLAGITANAAFDPVSALREAPLIDGQISRYYTYLLGGLEKGNTTDVVADLLGLIDFGVTEEDLKAIFPALARHIPAALSYLSPVLTRLSAQGGVRIYHESFRRFIVERLKEGGGSVADVIAPVIEWLKERGFYEDAKAYRFLLPCLRRAGRNREALEIVDAQFVSSSVYAGHSRRAIEENLKLATYVAADETDWAALARCAELLRSCVTCFEQKLLDVESFGRAYAAIFGAKALNDRLLLDGRPTFSASLGLIFCSLCDDAGEVPPWQTYLDLDQETEGRHGEAASSSDGNWETLAVAKAHGILRLENGEEVFERLARYLGQLDSPPTTYLRPLLRRVVQFSGVDALSRIDAEARMANEVRSVVLIELSRALAEAGQDGDAHEAVTRVARGSQSIELLAECLSLGADKSEVARLLPGLSNIDIALNGERYHLETEAMRQWVAGVKIAAVTSPQEFDLVSRRVVGVGWYRAWLRFVISLARAEAQSATDQPGAQASILRAFADLASDTRPFVGTPRACDLYRIHGVIHETISRGLRILREEAAWIEALGYLEKISRGTTTYLQRSPSGPLTPEAVIEVLMAFITDPRLNEHMVRTMRGQLDYVERGGELYDVHASLELLVVRALATGGHVEEARELWRSASIHLSAYGFRKDTTIFELIESAPALAKLDKARACSALAALQPLVNAVVEHTDGKETKHAPAYWVGALGEVDPAGAALLLARSLVKHGGIIDWRHEDAAEQLIDDVRVSADPLLVFFIEATLPFNERVEDAEARLKVIARLYDQDAVTGEHALHLLAAQVHGDSEHFNPAAYAKVEAFAAAKGVRLPAVDCSIGTDVEKERDYSQKPDPLSKFKDAPVFPADAPPLRLMTSIRQSRRSFSERSVDRDDRFINAFGYRLVELLDQGEEEQAIRLIRYFARESYFGIGASPLADLAVGLERYGYTRAAAVAFALAYASSRGNGGWNILGDQEHLPWASRAFDLSEPDAARTLTNEVAHLLNDRGYISGISRHLVELCAAQERDPEIAFRTWHAAFEVVKHRLPDNENDDSVFDETYVPGETAAWTLSEALALLLLARVSHPELRRKTTALAGIAAITKQDPQSLVQPLKEFLRVDTPISSALLVLHALVEAEADPYPVTLELRDELQILSGSDIFGLRLLAETLLERAGEEPGAVNRLRTFAMSSSLPEEKQEGILSIDWGERVERIAQVWEDFPQLVARRFDYLWEGHEWIKERAKSRYKAAHSRVRRELPPTPMLFWEQELFESVFHEILNGIDDQFLQDDEWTDGSRAEVGSMVLPRVHLHVADWHSRATRPPLPLPSDQREGIEAVTPMSDGDEYAGWYRCGYFERQLLMGERGMFSCDGLITVMAGIQFPGTPDVFKSSEIPFAMGNADLWWAPYDLIPEQPDGFIGCAVGLDPVNDLIGRSPILSLQPGIVARLKLRAPASWQKQLALADTSGTAAVVFRSWGVRPVGDSVDEENLMLEGCDLLIRPDVFELMRGIGVYPPSTVRWIKHNRLGSDSADNQDEDSEVETMASGSEQ
jgi:hypothetical protein